MLEKLIVLGALSPPVRALVGDIRDAWVRRRIVRAVAAGDPIGARRLVTETWPFDGLADAEVDSVDRLIVRRSNFRHYAARFLALAALGEVDEVELELGILDESGRDRNLARILLVGRLICFALAPPDAAAGARGRLEREIEFAESQVRPWSFRLRREIRLARALLDVTGGAPLPDGAVGSVRRLRPGCRMGRVLARLCVLRRARQLGEAQLAAALEQGIRSDWGPTRWTAAAAG